MAALILATVFSLVYFVSTQRRSVPAPAAVSGASIAVPAAALPPPVEANHAVPAEREAAAPEKAEPPKEEIRIQSGTVPMPAPVKKATAKTTERKPVEEPKKEESKVGSILKKTGRILKKPFKF
jgi:hypothetical protein